MASIPSISDSSKELYLPTEVWLNIFELASFVPNALDTHAPDFFSDSCYLSQTEVRQGISRSLEIKRTLVTVCKLWYELATRFLYQSIIVIRPHALKMLLQVLKNEEPCASGWDSFIFRNIPKGHWTKRLDVIFLEGNSFLDRDFGSRSLHTLIESMPNLQVLHLEKDSPWHYDWDSDEVISLFDALTNKTVHSLRAFYMNGRRFAPAELHEAVKAVQVHPMRILSIVANFDEELKKLVLPDIEYLDVPYNVARAFLSTPLDVPPSSFYLSLCGLRHKLARDICHGMSSQVLQGLTTLELDDKLWSLVGQDERDRSNFEAFLRAVTTSCPNLRSIIIDISDKSNLPPSTFLPPIERLGIRLCTPGSELDETRWIEFCGQICEMLEHFIQATPTINLIRLVSFNACTGNYVDLQEVLQSMSSKLLINYGVRFEDRFGRLYHEDRSVC